MLNIYHKQNISYKSIWSATSQSDQLQVNLISYKSIWSATSQSDQLQANLISYKPICEP